MHILKGMSEDKIYQNNPHLVQWKESGMRINKVKGIPPLNPNLEDPEYSFSEEEITRTVCHWGQRKLFLTELQFLLNHSEEDDTVIYIGAAPGIHISLLAELTPDINFHLYDRLPFDSTLKQKNNIKIFGTYFEEENIYDYTSEEEYEGKILFMSDIRTADTDNEDKIIIEQRIERDMQLQASLYEQLAPRKALLKFRLPYLHVTNNPVLKGATTFNYLDGEVMIQPFGRRKSTETRLIPSGPGIYCDWDLKKYSDAMYTHNYKTRVSYYEKYDDIDGLDRCYDCTLEKMIWKKYIDMYGDDKETTVQQMKNLTKKLNKFISGKNVDTPISRTRGHD